MIFGKDRFEIDYVHHHFSRFSSDRTTRTRRAFCIRDADHHGAGLKSTTSDGCIANRLMSFT